MAKTTTFAVLHTIIAFSVASNRDHGAQLGQFQLLPTPI
mgnify:CR=1 FL=1